VAAKECSRFLVGCKLRIESLDLSTLVDAMQHTPTALLPPFRGLHRWPPATPCDNDLLETEGVRALLYSQ
jgi:hypothetical protein